MTATLSVIVPTLNAAEDIGVLLSRLLEQTIEPNEIIIIDSSSDDETVEIAKKFPKTRTQVIKRCDFNHGLTRHLAFTMTTGEYVCFLTQDAVPADSDYLRWLIEPLETNKKIALSYGRQLPKKDARRFEQLVREFNYPASAHTRSKKDLNEYGIKTYFASDVCSCYRRRSYFECGGFSKVNTNEDMLMAARLIGAGYEVAYASKACVLHSHNLTVAEQYRRNREIGVFLKTHERDFGGLKETTEGIQLVKYVGAQLLKERSFGELCAFLMDCAARIIGNKIGKKDGGKDAR